MYQTLNQDGRTSIGGVGFDLMETCENDSLQKESFLDMGKGQFDWKSGRGNGQQKVSLQGMGGDSFSGESGRGDGRQKKHFEDIEISHENNISANTVAINSGLY